MLVNNIQCSRAFGVWRNISTMVVAKVYKIEKYFEGVPKATDLKIIEEQLPPIKDGGILKKTLTP